MQNFIGHDFKVGILQSPNTSYRWSLTWLWQNPASNLNSPLCTIPEPICGDSAVMPVLP